MPRTRVKVRQGLKVSMPFRAVVYIKIAFIGMYLVPLGQGDCRAYGVCLLPNLGRYVCDSEKRCGGVYASRKVAKRRAAYAAQKISGPIHSNKSS